MTPKYLDHMIDHDYLIIESLYFAIRHPPTAEYYEKMDPKEAKKVEKTRMFGEKVGLPLLGMMRVVARQFPYKAVEGKVTPEWLKRRGREKFPELVKVIEEKGPAGEKWLQAQCREIVQFATGDITWSDVQEKMVPIQVKQTK